MKQKHQRILKKASALILILSLILSAVPAAMAASADWNQLLITLAWTNEAGEVRSVNAAPVTETETGEGVFWALIPTDAPLDGLTLSHDASKPWNCQGVEMACTSTCRVLAAASMSMPEVDKKR